MLTPEKIGRANNIYTVILDKAPISIEEFVAVARYHAIVEFSQEYIDRVIASRNLAARFLDENRKIYGLTTGFGENVNRIIPQDEAVELQINIIRSHATSVGKPLKEEAVRAVWLMQLLSLGKGFSGIRIETLFLIANALNVGLTPYVPGEGSVQYLAIEAQMNLVLMGEGKAWYKGRLLAANEALYEAGLKPFVPACKEGLCLTNGANSATALAALALYDCAVAVQTSDIAAAMSYEALKGNILACDPRVQSLKEHPHQAACARNIVRLLSDSGIASKYKGARVQDPLALRSIPQMHGAIKCMIQDCAKDILEEMDSCSDNPILWNAPNEECGLMGANFDGTYASGAADILCIASANLGKLLERRIDKLTNRHFSGYPAFLAENPGVDNGYMIVQYTAAGLLNEIRGLSLPSTADSIPTCGNWEDPVSMGWWASRKAWYVGKKIQYIAAIEIMTLCRAFDLEKEDACFSSATSAVHDKVRSVVPPITEDRHFGPDIEKVFSLVRSGEVIKTAEEITGTLEF
ncbi:hypothetical protein B5F39_07470 [Cloacibacillus sp. An23]|nr:hypothetical protein B5F39_07470 [Cloacibacillus sp. An23]